MAALLDDRQQVGSGFSDLSMIPLLPSPIMEEESGGDWEEEVVMRRKVGEVGEEGEEGEEEEKEEKGEKGEKGEERQQLS